MVQVCFPTLSELCTEYGVRSNEQGFPIRHDERWSVIGDLLDTRKWSDHIRILEVTSVCSFDQVREFATEWFGWDIRYTNMCVFILYIPLQHMQQAKLRVQASKIVWSTPHGEWELAGKRDVRTGIVVRAWGTEV